MMYILYNSTKHLTQVQVIILLYFISRPLMTHEVAVYDIVMCRHTVQIYSLSNLGL